MSSAAHDFVSLIQRSQNILIVTPPNPSDDAVCSAIGLSLLLEKQLKNVSLFLSQSLPERLSFIQQPNKTVTSLNGARDFILIFNTQKNRILKVKTQEKDTEYIIRITPENGSIDPRDFSFVPAEFKYDLVIVINAASLESLDYIYQNNTDLFFEVPKINIDNQSSNENFGQVNLVNLTASSVGEIIAELAIEQWEKMIDKPTAEAFLAGIVSSTESFQKPCTTPASMMMAAKLMKYKAEQPNIIRHLYKTKSLPFLKLWGRVMARLNWNEKYRAAWSLVSIEDFVQSRASEKDIPYVLEQIQENFSQGQMFAIFHNETATTTVAQLRFANENIARQVANLFNVPFNQRLLRLTFESKNLLQAEADFWEKMESI